MSSQHRKKIAKEIVDQTLSHFKKQREEATRKQLQPQKLERKSGEKYEPGENFYKIFGQIMGEKPKASKNVKLNENPKFNRPLRETTNQSKENETEHITKSFNEKSDPPQVLQKKVEPEHKEENTSRPPQSSVFKKLSRRAIDS